MRVALLLVLLVHSYGFGERRRVASSLESNREKKRVGFLLGLHDPSPAAFGAGVGFNIVDYIQFSGAYGEVGTETVTLKVVGMTIKFFLPRANLSPYVAGSFAQVRHEGLGRLNGFSKNGNHYSMGVGIDWQWDTGFALAMGYTVSTRQDVPEQAVVKAGWFIW